jgi:hypothetical protein
MAATQPASNGATRVAYLLGVPLVEDVVRQWPQMGEIVRTRRLIADVDLVCMGIGDRSEDQQMA